MNRSWIVFGLIVIVGMLLIPPKEVSSLDHMGAAADKMFGGTPTRAEHTKVRVVYTPVWSEPEGKDYETIQNSSLATSRLLLQVVVVVVVFGGLALLTGTTNEDD